MLTIGIRLIGGKNLTRKLTIALFLGAVAVCAVPASAGLIQLLPDNSNCNGCNNILFKLNDTGNPILASTQAGKTVSISQNLLYGNLYAPSSGQARVQQESGDDFYGLFIDFRPGSLASLFEFTVDPKNQGGATGMTVTFTNNAGETFTFDLGSVGQNRHTWKADAGDAIQSATIAFTGGTVNAVEQIRIAEGSTATVGGDPVPEPASILLMGGGLLACGIFGRKRLAAKLD